MVPRLNAHLIYGSYNLVNFQPILTNEVSKSRLEFYLFNGISFVDISIFKAELYVFKFVSIFWDTWY